MSKRPLPNLKNRSATKRNTSILSNRSRRAPLVNRTRTRVDNGCHSFTPPEDWHEPTDRSPGEFDIIVQGAGQGFMHILTPAEIRGRLAQLPDYMLAPLDVIQLSRMTRKKQRFPCYGMQWGTALYLYPLEEDLVERFNRPPKPAQRTEARIFGGRWVERSGGRWDLIWTKRAIKDFYLNNVLIHELGHLLDDRNSSYADRERYAEWFAIRYGYQAASRRRSTCRRPRRRHH